MTKEGDHFSAIITVAEKQDLVFKFIVNGEWVLNPEYKVVSDENGLENNQIDADDLVLFEEFEEAKEKKEGDEIHQVLTGSSFAALSIPSETSKFEDLADETPPDVGRDDTFTSTPTAPSLSDLTSTIQKPDYDTRIPGSYPVSSAKDEPQEKSKGSMMSRLRGLFK